MARNGKRKLNNLSSGPQSKKKRSTFLERLDGENSSRDESELSAYLKIERAPRSTNVLNWWISHQQDFSHLSMMALDVLSIPATSTPAERLFSEAGELISERRNRLLPDTIRAALCLSGWSDAKIIEL